MPCGPEAAETVHRLTRAAFAHYDRLDPPSGAGRENLESVRVELAHRGGALAHLDGVAVGCLRLDPGPDGFHVRRVAVDPAFQGRGVGRALMGWAEAEARRRRHRDVTVGVRLALPQNIRFYRRLGYEIVSEHAHTGYRRSTWVKMRKRLQEPQ